MSGGATADYLISLCTIVQQSNESLGIATRIGSTDSMFQFEASKVIHSILIYSPAPDMVAVEFLNELRKINSISLLGKAHFYIHEGFADLKRARE
jgi:hypothetical protein